MTDEKLQSLIEQKNKPFYDSCFKEKRCAGLFTDPMGGGTAMIHCQTHGHKFMFIQPEEN